MLSEPNRVVVEDSTAILEAEELIQTALLGPNDPCRLRFLSAHHEAPVVSGQETPQHLVGLLAVAGVGQAQFAGQAVLEGSP